jgi:hypothetical protein
MYLEACTIRCSSTHTKSLKFHLYAALANFTLVALLEVEEIVNVPGDRSPS